MPNSDGDAAALDGRSDPERPRRRVAAAARRSGRQIGEPARDRDRNRRDGIGRAADGARRARAWAGPGDDGRGRRSAVGLSDGPPGAAHTGPAAGADPRVARHVDRAGPQDVAATGRRADGGAAARHRHPGNGNRPARCRADRAPAASGLAIPQGGARRTVRPADPGAGARLGGQRGAGLAGRRGAGRIGAHRKLDAGGQPAAARRKPAERATGSTDSTGPKGDVRARTGRRSTPM